MAPNQSPLADRGGLAPRCQGLLSRCAAVIQMPCQILRSGGRLIYRLLSWNPWQGMFLRLVERLQGCWLF